MGWGSVGFGGRALRLVSGISVLDSASPDPSPTRGIRDPDSGVGPAGGWGLGTPKVGGRQEPGVGFRDAGGRG